MTEEEFQGLRPGARVWLKDRGVLATVEGLCGAGATVTWMVKSDKERGFEPLAVMAVNPPPEISPEGRPRCLVCGEFIERDSDETCCEEHQRYLEQQFQWAREKRPSRHCTACQATVYLDDPGGERLCFRHAHGAGRTCIQCGQPIPGSKLTPFCCGGCKDRYNMRRARAWTRWEARCRKGTRS